MNVLLATRCYLTKVEALGASGIKQCDFKNWKRFLCENMIWIKCITLSNLDYPARKSYITIDESVFGPEKEDRYFPKYFDILFTNIRLS